jgi:adenosylhomocysteine nucleosidase
VKGNIAIIAALAAELKPLVSDRTAQWKRLDSSKGTEVWEYRHKDGCWVAACAGMGADRARLAFAEVEKVMTVDAVCSVGWAGALIASIPAASVCWVKEVVDTGTGERFRVANWSGDAPTLATTARVADETEKQRLAASYGASLVDMEAAAIARLAAARSIPFYSVKAISDDAGARLPDINPFIGRNGQLTMLPFLLHVAIRPWTWVGLAKLGKNSSRAADNLASAIYNWMDERAYARRGNGGYSR